MISPFKKIDEAYKTNQRFRALVQADEPIRKYGWGIIVAGQVAEIAKVGGQYIFPRFVRWHLSNIADASTAGAMLNGIQMSLSVLFNKKAVSRPIACAAFALAINTGWEMTEARMPNRHFDWGDEACHILSATAYAALGTRRRLKAEAGVKAQEHPASNTAPVSVSQPTMQP